MSFEHNTYSIPSATGISDLFIQSITPAGTDKFERILLIVHGMAEYSDRYLEAAEYFSEKGLPVFMYDHAGHGKSVKTDDDLGYFGEKDGNEKIVDDTNAVVAFIRKQHPESKIIVWGHSMGSFVTRRFAAKYPDAANGLVICGTAGSNPAAALGAVIADVIGKVRGSHYRSNFINNLAFGSYNKNFEGNTGFEWLSVNEDNITKYVADKYCGFLFTAFAYRDMFRLLGAVSKPDAFTSVPKNKPIFLIAGSDDPVGNYGKGVQEVYEKYRSTGHSDIKIKLYKGLRHEIHNEKCNQEIYDDIFAFASRI